MASMICSSDKKHRLMLKDYLRDDLSSCSSNGFKSFPRRQCCITVRFLLEIDPKTNTEHRRQAASTTISVLQKASVVVINAVKLLPFPSSLKSSSPLLHNGIRKRGILLPRILSRKLFRKSYWRKADHKEREGSGNKRLRLFRDFLQEREEPSPFTAAFSSSRVSTSLSSSRWSSESYSSQNAATEGQKDLQIEKKVSEGVGVTGGQDSITFSVEKNTKEWSSEADKEQFSPVSVLDCPFEDEEEIRSPFQRNLVQKEGAKYKFMAKIRRSESLSQLDPQNLENQMELAVLEDETLKSAVKGCSLSVHNNMFSNVKQEKSAHDLLKIVKGTTPSNDRLVSKADNVLLDFFREKIKENKESGDMVEGYNKGIEKELEIAQDWISGHPKELFLEWEVKDSRIVYVRDMESKGKWRDFEEEKEELVLELELVVFTCLVNETILDLLG